MVKICEASCLLEAKKNFCFQNDYLKESDHSFKNDHSASLIHHLLSNASIFTSNISIALLIVCSAVFLFQNIKHIQIHVLAGQLTLDKLLKSLPCCFDIRLSEATIVDCIFDTASTSNNCPLNSSVNSIQCILHLQRALNKKKVTQ